jgi:uncharacterized protein (DUF1501 family)
MKSLSGLAMTPLFFRAMAAEAATSNNLILVTILLSGGNDGLNTVVPLGSYGSYAQLRTPATPPQGLQLAYTEAQLAPLAFNANPSTTASQATQFAFAPSMTAMRDLYATGHLAVVAGVGLPPAEQNALSHYNASQDWLTGQINISGTAQAGWLGLTLQGAAAGALGPTASLSGTSQVIETATSQGLVLSSPIDQYGIYYGNSDDYYGLVKSFNTILAMPGIAAGANTEKAAMNSAMSAIGAVHAIATAQPATDYPAPATALDYQLRDIARLIIGGAGIRGYAALQEGYDTHASQSLTHPVLLSQLSTAMSNFYQYLQAKGASSNVVVMTLSDFGRRPAANLDFGTDHGGGGVSFVLGDPVSGGVFGQYPSLTQFDVNQNLTMQVDFRNVISDVVQAMGGNPTPILGSTYPRLGFL